MKKMIKRFEPRTTTTETTTTERDKIMPGAMSIELYLKNQNAGKSGLVKPDHELKKFPFSIFTKLDRRLSGETKIVAGKNQFQFPNRKFSS